jgi:hypothetical protein
VAGHFSKGEIREERLGSRDVFGGRDRLQEEEGRNGRHF